MSYLDPTTWRAFTTEEMSAYLAELGSKKGAKKRGGRKGGNRPVLVLQKTISPFDAYTYLHARFGAPNGLQTFLARNDRSEEHTSELQSLMRISYAVFCLK